MAHIMRHTQVRTIVVEGNGLDPSVMSRYQRHHGYHVYRLDVVDERRFITAKGCART